MHRGKLRTKAIATNFICQEMWRKIQEVYRALAEAGKFIEWQRYRLRRLQSEMRTKFKKSVIEKEA